MVSPQRLTTAQREHAVLDHLARMDGRGPIRAVHMAAAIGCSSMGLGALLGSLERRGLVRGQRLGDGNDTVCGWEITPDGWDEAR